MQKSAKGAKVESITPSIKAGDLPEVIEFILTSGEKIAISHHGNRLRVAVLGGSYRAMVHPTSSNTFEIIPANQSMSSELSQPPNPPK